jgi:hypothetical protein
VGNGDGCRVRPKEGADNHARLAELYRQAEPDLFILCAHDLAQYERAKATA